MTKDLKYNLICDFKKKDINPIERGRLIKEYMKENKMSIRAFMGEFGIPKSTVHDWVNFAKITEEKYDEYLKEGYTHTEIARDILRNHKDGNKFKKKVDFESKLYEFRDLVRMEIKKGVPDAKVEKDLEETITLMNSLLETIRRRRLNGEV